MAKLITYVCDEPGCINTFNIDNGPDVFPKGWYSQVLCMGRKIKHLCPECYKKMCASDNGFLGGD